MKHITLTALIGFCLSSWAQDFPIPYNPDSDLNGLIGSPDLLSLLAVYGEEFSAAVVAEDNESAIMYMGDMAYPLCAQSCKNLPGMWEMPTIEDLGLVWSEVHSSCCLEDTWLVRPLSAGNGASPFWFFRSDDENTLNPGYHSVVQTNSPAGNKRCYCSIKEIPKVEYTHCGHTNFNSCVNEKVAAGWQLLGGISSNQANTSGNYSGALYQAFWRWAE